MVACHCSAAAIASHQAWGDLGGIRGKPQLGFLQSPRVPGEASGPLRRQVGEARGAEDYAQAVVSQGQGLSLGRREGNRQHEAGLQEFPPQAVITRTAQVLALSPAQARCKNSLIPMIHEVGTLTIPL